MSETKDGGERSVRRRRLLKWLGRGYLTYHSLAAIVLVVLFLAETRPRYWTTSVVGELILMALVFPLVIPALIVSGGPHGGGGGVRLLAALPILLLTIVAAITGMWLAVAQLLRRRRT